MGGSRKSRTRKYSSDSSDSSSSISATSSSDDERSSRHRKRRHERSRKDKRSRKDSGKKRRHSSRDDERERRRRRDKKKKRKYDSDSDESSGSESESEPELENPQEVVKFILKEFPAVAAELQQILQIIDGGKAVDIGDLLDKSLAKQLRRLFISLNLKEKGDQFFLRQNKAPTLDVVGSVISSHVQPAKEIDGVDMETKAHAPEPEAECKTGTENVEGEKDDGVGPRRRVMGPAMPSADLLAAAAKLTEAEAELRQAELDGDDGLFIGPPPPAVVREAASSNEAERFEEITRIMAAPESSLYDVLGVNHNMPAEIMKKRYWKLSLMVHPDKCSHPQAQQAFVKLNKAFKDLQDPDKRKALDDKIKAKEEQEARQAEIKQMIEAAQWRRLQGISMEGDDELLAQVHVKMAPSRDEWMTSLPPERKPAGVPTQSTRAFSKNAKEGRGDTSMWTDTPSERAQKAKTNYLEAYNEAAALASNELEKKVNPDAELVDKYNKEKRSKSLVEKHRESTKSRVKKKSKKESSTSKEEWEENHPWKPWDREKDLTAGRLNVKLDPENMTQGLTSRFSSGSFQRNFL